MRIGIVLTASYQTGLGAAVHVRERVSALSEIGHEVHVLTPFPQYDFMKLTNVTIHRIGSQFKYNRLSLKLLAQIQDYKLFWRRYLLRGGLEKAARSLARELLGVVQGLDLDVLQGEQDVAALACAFLGEKLRIPTVASLHNIAPEELVARRIISRNDLQYQMFINLIRKIVASSKRTIVVSEEMKDFLINNYLVDGDSILVLPLAAHPRIKEVTFCDRPNRIVYAGLASRLDNPLLFVKSIPFVATNHSESEFYMTKRGEELPTIRRFVKRKQIPLSFYWYKDITSFFRFLLTCHVGVVTSANNITRKFGWAMKFFDYLSAGLPVVANDIGGWTRVIREERVGLLCDSSPNSLGEAILYLLDNPDVRYDLAKRALHLANTRFSVSAITKRLSDDLHTLRNVG